MRWITCAGLSLVALINTSLAAQEMAFPGAEGWAAATPGGRGGKILRVTTLRASGPGSFAAALNSKGPRIIVFEVGGAIDLDRKTLRITEPFVTIAGQTAPSPGITFIRGGLQIQTHDVVMQHIRIRPGAAGQAKGSNWEVDGLTTLHGSYNVVVDHCSFSWSTDENLSISGKPFEGANPDEWRKNTSRRITYSNNIVAEGLSQATHTSGEHSKGTLVMDNSTEILIHRNLYAHNSQRHPLAKGGTWVAVVNNVMYNPGFAAVAYREPNVLWKNRPHVLGRMDLVGNVMRYGADTRKGLTLLRMEGEGDLELHAADNLALDRAGQPVPLTEVAQGATGRILAKPSPVTWPGGLKAMPAAQVEEYVLRNAGARAWDRDTVDTRIVRQVRERTGEIIDSEQEVGGYPAMTEARQPFDPSRWDLATMTRRTTPAPVAGPDSARAFPGAEGWAAFTRGGRGGKILRVTTLAATGPGSFDEALNTRGPRIIVFEVGGVIDLNRRTLKLTEPFVTIAGQTAPSPGITFIRGSFFIQTHDVVVQHIRVRPGEAGQPKKSGWEPDGLTTLHGSRNVVVDHCSFTWGVDENLSVSGEFFDGANPEEWRRSTSQRITYSNNIIAEGLSRSTHAEGPHSKGTLLMDNTTEILLLANLFANNVERNPQIKGGAFTAIVNNLIYNPVVTAVHYHMTGIWQGREPVVARNEVVGNVMRHGPDTPRSLALFRFGGVGDMELHEADNLAYDRSGNPAPIVFEDLRYGGRLRQKTERVYWPDGLRPLPAAQVEAHVYANAGARPWDRDPIDQRIVAETRAGTGRVIDSEHEVGGYPTGAGTRQPFDPGRWNLADMTPRSAR